MNQTSSETKMYVMYVLSLPKVMSYKTQVIKKQIWIS